MKKIVVSVAFIATNMIALPFGASAQEGVQVGIEGTPQMSWLVNQDDSDNSKFEYLNTFNGSFGISGQYGFTASMGLGLNVLYSFQGQRYKFDGVEQIKKLEYLKLPVMLIYNYEINPDWVFTGKIGPQIDLLANAKLTDKDGKDIVSDQKNAYEDFDIAAVVSTGIGYKLNENLSLDAALRFDYGFTDAENKDYKKNINHPNGAITTTRALTSNLTGGMTVGLRYLFKEHSDK